MLRDGLACCYCGEGIEDGATLTLDHLLPYASTGRPNHSAGNLVAACRRCNSSRGDRAVDDFASAVAEYLDRGVQAEAILRHISQTTARPIDLAAAKQLIAQRGSFAAALQRSNR